jgi:hypothetical protein
LQVLDYDADAHHDAAMLEHEEAPEEAPEDADADAEMAADAPPENGAEQHAKEDSAEPEPADEAPKVCTAFLACILAVPS